MAATLIAMFLLCAFVMIVSGSLEEECTILMKLDSLEARVQEQEISLLKQAVNLAEKDTRIGDLEQSMTEKDTRIGELEARLSQQATDISELRSTLNDTLNINTTVLANLEQRLRPVQAIGFTAGMPRESQTASSQMAFGAVRPNEGGALNADTGVFTCPVAGLYYFSATLLKFYSYDGSASCNIIKNSGFFVTAYTSPGHSPQHGDYPVVNGGYSRLAVNDTVRVGACTTPIETVFSGFSTFTGFLVTPDD